MSTRWARWTVPGAHPLTGGGVGGALQQPVVNAPQQGAPGAFCIRRLTCWELGVYRHSRLKAKTDNRDKYPKDSCENEFKACYNDLPVRLKSGENGGRETRPGRPFQQGAVSPVSLADHLVATMYRGL